MGVATRLVVGGREAVPVRGVFEVASAANLSHGSRLVGELQKIGKLVREIGLAFFLNARLYGWTSPRLLRPEPQSCFQRSAPFRPSIP
jgi:hypothetical protein